MLTATEIEEWNQESPMTEDYRSLCVPTVNLNGTSKDALLSQLRQQIITATALAEFLAEGMPHDRDYHMQGPGVGNRARLQQRDRILKVELIIAELYAIADGINAQDV